MSGREPPRGRPPYRDVAPALDPETGDAQAVCPTVWCAEVTVSAQRVGLFRGIFGESGARVFRHVLSC